MLEGAVLLDEKRLLQLHGETVASTHLRAETTQQHHLFFPKNILVAYQVAEHASRAVLEPGRGWGNVTGKRLVDDAENIEAVLSPEPVGAELGSPARPGTPPRRSQKETRNQSFRVVLPARPTSAISLEHESFGTVFAQKKNVPPAIRVGSLKDRQLNGRNVAQGLLMINKSFVLAETVTMFEIKFTIRWFSQPASGRAATRLHSRKSCF